MHPLFYNSQKRLLKSNKGYPVQNQYNMSKRMTGAHKETLAKIPQILDWTHYHGITAQC